MPELPALPKQPRPEIGLATKVKGICPTCGRRLRRFVSIDGHSLEMTEVAAACPCGRNFKREVVGTGRLAVTTLVPVQFNLPRLFTAEEKAKR